MIHKVYTVYDKGTEAYLPPFFLPAKGAAVRAFSDLVNDSNHQFGKHPSDYDLFELGSYDDNSSFFTLYDQPSKVGNGIEFLKQN